MAAVRILHLHSSFDLGDAQLRTVRLMNHFGNQAEHTLLSAVHDAFGAADALDRRVKMSFPKDAAPALGGTPNMARYRRLAAYMKKFHLVLSYNFGAMDGVMAHTLFTRGMKLPPLIHHEDGFEQDEVDRLKWHRNWFRTIALQRADALVVPSKTLEHIARTFWHQPLEKIARFPNGIDTEHYNRRPQRGSFPGFQKRDGEIIVGTIADLRSVKNLPRLLRAVAAADANIRLAIVGEGPDRDVIMAEATRLGIADRVMMPGYLRDPARYIRLFDIFALSSDSEQYPISLVEAMTSALPIVATDVGDVRNIVSRENRPFIVARDDEDALASAINSLAKDAALRATLATANRILACSQYDEDTMFARYRQLYGSAMKRADFARQS
ncbi:glycosyltransferase family 4 protein [Sphingorhabdus wooponensis]|jgi:glycosyltransferase involved in cell wall biosynthesis|uniref:Glycosyltransferase n=1 Tax=Sphingorhabdus wooponensis TaxID=940136 RepID=A0A3R8R4L4_9SPHN|nr:glycosyltransferase family 4 protein [Sphingorhabdus wooponensis]RRQ51787.1 glycosyltransferase [Sphingorhabdus wooponensis]